MNIHPNIERRLVEIALRTLRRNGIRFVGGSQYCAETGCTRCEYKFVCDKLVKIVEFYKEDNQYMDRSEYNRRLAELINE